MPGKNGRFSQAAVLPSVTALRDLSSLVEAITLSNNIDRYQPYGLLYPMLQSSDFLCKIGEGAALLGDGPVEFRWCCHYLSLAGSPSEGITS